MDVFISPARRRLVESFPCYFPFGRKHPQNALKDYRGSQAKDLKVTKYIRILS